MLIEHHHHHHHHHPFATVLLPVQNPSANNILDFSWSLDSLSQWPSQNISFPPLQPLELFWVRLILSHL
jgi:hypothetical protein